MVRFLSVVSWGLGRGRGQGEIGTVSWPGVFAFCWVGRGIFLSSHADGRNWDMRRRAAVIRIFLGTKLRAPSRGDIKGAGELRRIYGAVFQGTRGLWGEMSDIY